MADIPKVLSQRRLTRDKLAKALGTDHDVIKAFENLQTDVTQTLPMAIAGATQDAGSIIAEAMFLPRTTQQPYVDPASQILAAQIFGA